VTLEEILDAVLASHPADWEYIADWRGDSNPERAVLRPDVSVSLEWGRTVTDPVAEPWTARFADKHSVGLNVDVLYHGAVVFRDYLISVDGGRCILPHPKVDEARGWTATKRQEALARAVHSLAGGSYDFDDYLRRSGIVSI